MRKVRGMGEVAGADTRPCCFCFAEGAAGDALVDLDCCGCGAHRQCLKDYWFAQVPSRLCTIETIGFPKHG